MIDEPLQPINEEESIQTATPLNQSVVQDEDQEEEKEAEKPQPVVDLPKLSDYEIIKADVAAGAYGSISIAMSKKKGIKVALKKMDAERI